MEARAGWQAEMAVVTPESVVFSYEVAGIGSRFLAVLVDHVIEALAFAALLLAAGSLGWTGNKYFPMLAITGSTLAYAGYFILFELLWDGQTPGKRLLGLRVVRDGGYGLTALECILRNVVRIIDFLPVFYGVGLVSMFLSEKSRRLGDFAAGTVVIKDQPSAIPSLVRLAGPAALNALAPEVQASIRRGVVTFNADELRVMREFLRRRHGLPPDARGKLAARLGEAVRVRLPELRDLAGTQWNENLIEAVVAAYEERGS